MEENEAVLSDVHINTKYQILSPSIQQLTPTLNPKLSEGGVPPDLQKLAVTRFEIPLQVEWQENLEMLRQSNSFTEESLQNSEKDLSSIKDTDLHVAVDGDGDFLLKRRNNYQDRHVERNNPNCSAGPCPESQAINIVHHLATERDGVGHQVWQGALLMSEFVLSHPHLFEGRVVVDLGAGVGLTSIIVGLQAKTVFSTDLHSSILRLSKYNADANGEMLWTDRNRIKVRRLDWMSDELKFVDTESVSSETIGYVEPDFSWTSSDRDQLRSMDTLIAADVVYDEDLTEGFFRTFHSFMSKPPPKVLYLSLEKRLVFTVSDMEICCPAYSHFRECLSDLHLCTDNGLQYCVEQLPTDFPQCFTYNRIPQLELWKISSVFESTSKDVT